MESWHYYKVPENHRHLLEAGIYLGLTFVGNYTVINTGKRVVMLCSWKGNHGPLGQ